MFNFFDPGKTFLFFSLLAGIPLVFITAPFEVPDEQAHYLRSYEISEGRLFPHNYVDNLPTSLQSEISLLDGTRLHHKFNLQILLKASHIELHPEQRSEQSFSTSAVANPIIYMPQAMGMLIGRSFGMGPLALIYAGRIANLLISTALIYLAICQLPVLRWLVVVLAFAPMDFYLRSSLSADAVTIAIAFLFSASIANLCFSRACKLNFSDILTLIISSAALCMTKLPYIPLILTLLALPAMKIGTWSRAKTIRVCLAGCLCATVITVYFATEAEFPIRSDHGIDPRGQIWDALFKPLHFLQVLQNDIAVHSYSYVIQFVGLLGWLNVELPFHHHFHFAFLAIMAALIILDYNDSISITINQQLLFALAAAISFILVLASQYAIWTPVGADLVEGVQGRYFYPIVIIAVWACYPLFIFNWLSNQGLVASPRRLALVSWITILASVNITLYSTYIAYWT